MAGRPKAGFYIIVVIVALVLVAIGLWRGGVLDVLFPSGRQETGTIDPDELARLKGQGGGAEAPDASSPTTVKEYAYVPAQKLPPVKGISNYKALGDPATVRFALNVWAGWGPIIFANNGFQASKVWKTPKGRPFQVDLVLIDDPVAMRDAYASGDVHIGWATLDMVPLFMEELRKDSRVMPRIFQQVDWSNGGDGIVVRERIESVTDLRGKKIVLAQNSPSHYFVLNALINGGVQPSEVKFVFTQDAFQAAAAFNSDRSIDAVVSWAPDIYNLDEVSGNRMLVTTATANKLIADVWFARADFAKDHPDIIEALVRGIFDAMVDLKQDANLQKSAQLMARGYSIPASETLAMFGDAHSTNYAENREFFLNQNNPANFQSIWETAYYLYKRIGAVTSPVPFDQVMDFSVIKKLGGVGKYANQRNEYQMTFAPRSVAAIKAESGEILTKTISIHFYPNSWDIEKMITVQEGGKTVSKLYDPNTSLVVEEVGRLAGQYGAARIIVEGNTDSSMKGKVPHSAVKELSMNRANAVKESLVRKFPGFDPDQFSVVGNGWEVPADPGDPDNHAKNRRVEIKVYPLEQM